MGAPKSVLHSGAQYHLYKGSRFSVVLLSLLLSLSRPLLSAVLPTSKEFLGEEEEEEEEEEEPGNQIRPLYMPRASCN